MQQTSSRLLDYLYQHLNEDDWLHGIELYQDNLVSQIKNFEGLITGKVFSNQKHNEVRIKIHPDGQYIQWIECTCPKNRAKNIYCEHIAALMLYIDRERPAYFKKLDLKMPLKANVAKKQPSPKQSAATSDAKSTSDGSKTKTTTTTKSILSHLQGLIRKVTLDKSLPGLKVELEIKSQQVTHYDLGIDESARFLDDPRNSANAQKSVRDLKHYDLTAIVGFAISQNKQGNVTAEKVICIENQKRLFEKHKLPAHKIAQLKLARLETTATAEKTAEFLVFKWKTLAGYAGDDFLLLLPMGFLKLEKKSSTNWAQIPEVIKYQDDEAAVMIETGYRELIEQGPLFMSQEMSLANVIRNSSLEQIKVISAGEGWFELDPSYQYGDDQVPMLDLIRHYQKTKQKYLRSGNKWFEIPEFIADQDWKIEKDSQHLKLSSMGLFRLQATLGNFDKFAGNKHMLDMLRQQITYEPPTEIPSLDNTKLSLRHYQEEGLAWLWWLYQKRLHGLLADEMGLGKTHQAMALISCIQRMKPDARFLIISPTSVLDHWYDKIVNFAPSLKPIIYHGSQRFNRLKGNDNQHATMITSYGIILRDINELAKTNWDAIILDEAHLVKNNKTATYRSACQLNSQIRLCLTGTPLENNLFELKSIFDFLLPGYLGSDDYFRKTYVNPITQDQNEYSEQLLQRLIYPFKLRRIKKEVLSDLPEKVEDLRHCNLSPHQVKLYKEVLALRASPLIEQLRDEQTPVPFLHVFATINLLKQICDHPALVEKDKIKEHGYHHWESGKFEAVKELIDEALGSGHKIVIFTQYLGMVDIFEDYLTKGGIGHVTFTGATKNRGKVIEKFQTDPNCKIFIGSLLAGGVGIDLTEASVVIHYDRWWNASKEDQATDRVHRIGQNKNVQVMKMVTKGTLEEKIDLLIERKKSLFERFVNKDEELFKNLSRQELIELLA